jgi:hypothetical protein
MFEYTADHDIPGYLREMTGLHFTLVREGRDLGLFMSTLQSTLDYGRTYVQAIADQYNAGEEHPIVTVREWVADRDRVTWGVYPCGSRAALELVSVMHVEVSRPIDHNPYATGPDATRRRRQLY